MKLAVFIDADNISAKYADEIMSVVEKFGDPITRRAYGSPSVFTGADSWKDAVRQYAIDARMPVNNVDRKNIADFVLLINAMDCLHSGHYDGFVIVSSDSDFTSLAIRMREEGKAVYGIGDNRVCQSFKAACTQFVELETKASAAPMTVAAKPSTAKQSTTPSASKPDTPKPTKPKASVNQKANPLYAGKDSAEFFAIATNLRLSKATTLTKLKSVMKNQKRTGEEAEQIIHEMQRLGIVVIDAQHKLAWCNDEKLKTLMQQHTQA